ncbi:MAG: hypothetical protein Q8936_16095 [Bacillota bacterium]|nr:hypothetical protein [Bacillota bacterium]
MSDIKNEIKILPMELPPIDLYPYSANKLSVLLSHKETHPWFFSNFIQTWISKDRPSSFRSYWSDFLFFSGYKFCPFYKTSTISRKLVQHKWNSIIDFIIDAIDLNYYAYLNINAGFIPEYESKEEKHWRHDIFVFGYDKKNETLKIADFFKGYKYYYSEVSFKAFQQAYDNFNLTNETDFFNGISLESFENTDYEFDINFISNSIKDYLDGCNTTITTDLSELENKDDAAYGIEVYDVLGKHLQDISMGKSNFLDIRPFHMIYNHKTVMIQRLKYLEKLNYIKNADKFIKDYIDLESQSLNLRHDILKVIITRSDKVLDRARTKLEPISIREKQVLSDILYSIK